MNYDSIRRSAGTALTAAIASGLLALPSAASAATVAYDGTTTAIVGTAAPESISASRTFENELSVYGAAPGPGCRYARDDDPTYGVRCPIGTGGVRIQSLGGNDEVVWIDSGEPLLTASQVQVDLGDGNDRYTSSQVEGAATVRGGAGDDDIEGSRQGDDLDGGAGDDSVRGFEGDDVVRGGEGDDAVSGDGATDRRGRDLVDGGPGRDSSDDWSDAEDHATITLDGVPNDGFAGEQDNVTGVEELRTSSGLDFDGDDGENHVTAGEAATTGGSLVGRGGDDTLSGTDRADRIDGGAGADRLSGGYGNDVIVGGPGRDEIMGDRPGRCNEYHCDLSPGSASDTIDAVDGEVDFVSCGPGLDVVRADAVDRVEADCEEVVRASAPLPAGPGGGSAGAGPGGAPAPDGGPAITVRTSRLKTALARGIRVQLAGVTPTRRVSVTAKVAGRRIGRGSARASASGTATVRIRLTSPARRRLARRGRVAITIRAAGVTQRVTLR